MIRLIKPYVSFNEVESEFKEIFDSGILTNGEYSRKFPSELKKYVGAEFAFNTTSATTALTLAMDILNVEKGDEVIVSDFSFPATANVVEQRGAIPVFVDVNLDTYNMDAELMESKITARTKAVIFVCALGNPSGVHNVETICSKHGIPLVVDAACALGSSENGRKIGNIGDISCFSFHPRKLITSGEGGAVTTSNKEYANKMSVKLMHGAILNEGVSDFVTYGYNYRLSELQCIMLLKQLEKLDAIIKNRADIQKHYIQYLESLGFIPQKYNESVVHNMQSIVFSVPEHMDRDDLIAYLREQGVESTIGTYCMSNCSFYRDKYKNVQSNSLWLEKHTISLPCYAGIVVNDVVDIIKNIFCTKDREG